MRVPFDEKVWAAVPTTASPATPGAFSTRLSRSSRAPVIDDAPVIVGFGSDEGVRRNQGRIGAAHASEAIAAGTGGLPGEGVDDGARRCGDVVCDDDDLEGAQAELATRRQRRAGERRTTIRIRWRP